jgi:hypothetical protein
MAQNSLISLDPEPGRLADQNHGQSSIRRQIELLWIKEGVSKAEAF